MLIPPEVNRRREFFDRQNDLGSPRRLPEMDPNSIDAVTVDSYSTLVDVDAQEDALDSYIDDIEDPALISQRWRCQYLLYSVIANDLGEYRPFSTLIDLGLQYALAAHGYDVTPATRDEIRRTVYEEELEVFEDVPGGIRRLHEAGYDVYVLSNGDPDMLEHLVDRAAIGDLIVDTISADEIETYKPDPAIYRHAARRVGVAIDRILHVSGGSMRDVWGAKHAGMRAAWLSRPSKPTPPEYLGDDPDMQISNFDELASRLE